jgi:hypothetical protein
MSPRYTQTVRAEYRGWSKMKESSMRTLVVLAVAAGTSAMAVFSAGVAAASPDQTGKAWSDAQTSLKYAGYAPVAATIIGDKSPPAGCKVIRQQDWIGGNNNWVISNTVNGVFVGNDQPTLYPGSTPYFPTAGTVFVTLACYGAKDAAAGTVTGSGDITTKPGS